MARIVDSTGTDWALMAAKDSVGRVYIRAYRNAWDVEKKRSYVQAKIQVGRLLEDGRIRLSKGFIERFPSYAEGEWYWGDKELVSETQFEEQFSPPPAQPDTSWSDSNIQVGQTWAAWQTAARTGLLDDLQKTFGADVGRTLLALAVYKLDGGGAMMNFEDWVAQVWLPEVQPLDGRRISEMLSNVTGVQTDAYFKQRYERACANPGHAVTLSMDGTSISTYSSTILDAAWGHAKQNPELKQVNYMAVVDHETGDVVYATSYDGSINDKAILPTIYERMRNAGLSLENNILVTDRGFNSIYNTQLAINLEIKYLQFMPISQQGTQEQFRRKKQLLTDPIAGRLSGFEHLSACTVEDMWSQSTDAGPVSVRAQMHLYRNHAVAEFEINRLCKDVDAVLEEKAEHADKLRELLKKHAEDYRTTLEKCGKAEADKLIKVYEKNRRALLAKCVVDDELWRRVAPFLKSSKDKDGITVWAADYSALSKAVEFCGCQAIRTNVPDMTAGQALKIYRQRQIIEQGFRQLKNEVGGSRFEATEAAYRGKLFVFTLAESIRMAMLATVSKNLASNPKLKLPGDSLRKVLLQLRSVQARKHCSTEAFVIGAVAKRYRDCLTLLGIEKLPKTVCRY